VKGAVYVNGIITPAREAVIPVYDHGFVYGEGVYETLRTYNRVPFLYDRHLRRLRASAAALHLDVPFDDDTLLGWIHDTMAVAERSPDGPSTPTPPIPPLNEAYIRILLTRGVGDLSYDLTATPAPSLVIIVKPFDEPPARMFDEGIKIVLVSILRNHPGSVNPIIKSNNLLNNALAMQEARRQGGEEALMCNYRGELSECSQSNFFLVRDGVALTPRSASGLLEGLTRAFLFEVGGEVGVRVEEATLTPADLTSAQEAFITGSTRELTPVVRIDDQMIGNGRPGPVTRALLAGFRKRAWELSARPMLNAEC
jgi:branched-chain amino acid aminotransferase